MATVNLGRIKPVFRGAYNNSTAYVVDDIVTSGNETFIAIAATQGNATSDGSKWTKLASKGTDGTAGDSFSLANKEIAFKTNAGALDGIPIGTAGQFLKVNSGATGYEFGAVSVGAFSINKIDHFNYQTTVTESSANVNYVNISGSNTVNFTPTSTNDKIFFSYVTNIENPGADRGCDIYLMMKAGSSSIGSSDTKLDYNGRHANYSGVGGNYMTISKSFILPCTSLSTSTTYYIQVAGATYNSGGNRFNLNASDATGDYKNLNVTMIHYKV